ncbi:MAG: dTDP-glucose 4,6-dehydratase [Candidatus Diapherotrites archaeon]|nr:dTDP-glucose 4,6-dehydratase [Candidatus Diapherotrites archaeon]
MHTLVTGGAGFIGSHFIRHRIAAHPHARLTNLDHLDYAASPQTVSELARLPRYSFIRGDITRPSDVKKAMKNADTVVHFAAQTHVDRSISDPFPFIHTNVQGTLTLLEEARKQDIEKFVHISTDEVYGSRLKGSFDEQSPLAPRNPYSASKAAADHLVQSYYETYGLPVCRVRPSNNFGPYQFPEKVIPFFITRLLDGQKVPLYGDGKNTRDWLYVEDTARAVDLVLRKGKAGEAYNIAPYNEKENIWITRFILKYLGLNDSRIQFVKDRPGHDRRYAMKAQKIRQLGWKPQVTLPEALRHTMDWYIIHSNWWMPLLKQKVKR